MATILSPRGLLDWRTMITIITTSFYPGGDPRTKPPPRTRTRAPHTHPRIPPAAQPPVSPNYSTTKGFCKCISARPDVLRYSREYNNSPVTIKRNFSLNKKVPPYLLRLTMMKGNEDTSFSCRYQYKYYWKVN